MELAKRGRSDDEIASGWEKIPAETRPIVASWAPNDRCSLTHAEFRWELWSVAPTLTTLNFSRPPSIAFRFIVHNRRSDIKTSASTKAITQKMSVRSSSVAITVRTSNLADRKPIKKRKTRASKLEDGSSKELIPGTIVFEDSSSGGRKNPKTISPCYNSHSLTQLSETPMFWDRL